MFYRQPRKYTGQRRYRRRYNPFVQQPRSHPVFKKFTRSYKHAGPDIFSMFFNILSGLIVLVVTLIIKLFQNIFRRESIIKAGTFKISNTQVAPDRDYRQEFKDFNKKIQALRTKTPDSEPVINADNKVEINGRYGLKESLLNESEKEFLEVLKQVIGDRYTIACQVPLSGIVTILDSNKNFTNYRDFNQIKAKTVDFVLYDKDYKPYLCIELDGNSHMRLDRIKRDMFINDLMKSVGLRIIHIYPASEYDPVDLKSKIFIS